MRFFLTILILFCFTGLLNGGTTPYKIMGKWYYPLKSVRKFEQKGVASWYGEKFHGRKTANGEIYDMHAMTAAHKTLPLGVFVEVHNLLNNKSCIVRINDRGPFVKDRIIDLSYKAAKILGVDGPGTAKVYIKVKSDKRYYNAKDYKRRYHKIYYTIQIASFKEKERAENLRKKLDKKFKYATVKKNNYFGTVYYRVRVGRAESIKKAMEYEETVVSLGFPDAFAVSE